MAQVERCFFSVLLISVLHWTTAIYSVVYEGFSVYISGSAKLASDYMNVYLSTKSNYFFDCWLVLILSIFLTIS